MLPISQTLQKAVNLEGTAVHLQARADQARRVWRSAQESLDPALDLLSEGEVVVDGDGEEGLARLGPGHTIKVTLIDLKELQHRIDRAHADAVETRNARMIALLAPLATPRPEAAPSDELAIAGAIAEAHS